VAKAIEHLLSKCKALSSNPSTANKIKCYLKRQYKESSTVKASLRKAAREHSME
jgi:hypothetical protein